MSKLMTNAIIEMPFNLAMHTTLSQEQFYRRAQAVLAENATLKNEVQRQLELRRLEWNRAEGMQAQVNELLKEIERLKRGAQA